MKVAILFAICIQLVTLALYSDGSKKDVNGNHQLEIKSGQNARPPNTAVVPTHQFPVYVHSAKRGGKNKYFRNPASYGVGCNSECARKLRRPLFIRLWNGICFFENIKNRRFRAFKGYCDTGKSISDFSRRCLNLMSADNADKQWLMACLTPEWRGLPVPEGATDFEIVSADPKNIPKRQCLILNGNQKQMLPCSLLPKESTLRKDTGTGRKTAFVRHHFLPVIIPEVNKCKIIRPDDTVQSFSGTCPLIHESTFLRRDKRCQLQFENRLYEAFPGFCETYDGRAIYGRNCDIMSFSGDNQDLYDTCKLEWDRRIVSKSKSQAYVIRIKSGLKPAGECLQTILTSADRNGRNIRQLVDCMAIGRSVNGALGDSDCLVVASSEAVPCDFDKGRLASSNGKKSMAEVLSAIRNYRRQKQPGIQHPRAPMQQENVTLLILPLCGTMGRFYAKIAPQACPTCLINGKTVSKHEADGIIRRHKLIDEGMDQSIYMYRINSEGHYTAVTICQLKDSCTYCPHRIVDYLQRLPYDNNQRSAYRNQLVAQLKQRL